MLGSVVLLLLIWLHFDSKPESQTQPQHQDVGIGFAPIPASPSLCTTTNEDQTSVMTDSTSTDDTGCIGISLPADVEIEEQFASTPLSAEPEQTDAAQSGLKRMLQSMFYKILQLLSKF